MRPQRELRTHKDRREKCGLLVKAERAEEAQDDRCCGAERVRASVANEREQPERRQAYRWDAVNCGRPPREQGPEIDVSAIPSSEDCIDRSPFEGFERGIQEDER